MEYAERKAIRLNKLHDLYVDILSDALFEHTTMETFSINGFESVYSRGVDGIPPKYRIAVLCIQGAIMFVHALENGAVLKSDGYMKLMRMLSNEAAKYGGEARKPGPGRP